MFDLRILEEETIAAPIDVVFGVITDHESFHEWSSCDESILERPGAPDRNGFGAVRLLRSGTPQGITIEVREEVNHFWPPVLLGYRVVEPAFLCNHQGIVRLSAEGADRTHLAWHVAADFSDPATADAMREGVRQGIHQLVADAAAEAERRAKP